MSNKSIFSPKPISKLSEHIKTHLSVRKTIMKLLGAVYTLLGVNAYASDVASASTITSASARLWPTFHLLFHWAF